MRNRTARRPRPANLSDRGIGTLPWSYFVVVAICACVIAAGFLLAARQHFVSMDLGMKNSKLRKQLEDFESENRRLTIAREVALSPVEITRTARSFGFVEVGEPSLAIPISVPSPKDPEKAVLVKAVALETKAGEVQANITRTTYQRPSNRADMKTDVVKKPSAAAVKDAPAAKKETAKKETKKETTKPTAAKTKK